MLTTLELWRHAADGFLSWWGRTLLDLIPRRLRAGLSSIPPTLTLDLDEAAVDLRLFAGRSRRHLGRVAVTDHDPARTRVALAEAIKGVKLARTRVAVRLPAAKGLRRQLRLPGTLDVDLDQAMAFQIDRMTPFSPDQVYFDYRVAERSAAEISVELIAVPRTSADQAVARLRDWGLEPQILDIADHGAETPPSRNLLSERTRQEAAPLWSPLNRVLGGVAALLLFLLTGLPLAERAAQVERLQDQLTQAKDASERVAKLRVELDQSERRVGFVLGQRAALPSRVAVIEALSRALPDDCWIFQLDISGLEVGIRGYGRDAAALITRLTEVEGFRRPRFRAPVVKDPSSGLDHFDLSFGLTP